MEEIRRYYVGIDLGGTFIKGGIVDDLGNILYSTKLATEAEKGEEGVTQNIAKLVEILLNRTGLVASDVEGIGMGVPGMIDSQNGIVVNSNKLKWYDFHIAERVTMLTGLSVKIANDANAAALAEAKFGAAKNKRNVIMLTLGTGVGGGIIANGKLIEGNMSAGAELGHSVIVKGGEPCTCGRCGCLEAYSSATALIRETKKAMKNNPCSLMWSVGSIDNVDGKTAFDYKDNDASAREVVDNYIGNLATGIVNFANIFRPEVILLGGGVCAEGDKLIKPIQKILDQEIYAGNLGPRVEVLIATLGNKAGTLGAASLIM